MFEIENKVLLELACLCSPPSLNGSCEYYFREPEFNWKYFSERCSDTMLSSVIYSRLRSSAELLSLIPDQVLTYFVQTQAQVIVKNTFLKSGFDKIIADFAKIEIDVIPLKGIYLLESYYKNFGHRQLSDIDLLVREKDLKKACEYFLKDGFDMEMYMPAKASKVSKTPAPYKFSKNGLVVDLHVGLTYIYDSCQFEMEKIWGAAEKKDREYFEMNSLDHAVYLFAHLIKHFDYRNCKLINFYDLYLVFEKDKINFNELINHSKMLGCEKDVKDICYILTKYFRADYFADYDLNDTPSRQNIDETFLEIVSKDRAELELKYTPQGSTGFMPIKYLNFKDKFIYIFSRFFPERQYIHCKYPEQKSSFLKGYLFHFRLLSHQVFRVI